MTTTISEIRDESTRSRLRGRVRDSAELLDELHTAGQTDPPACDGDDMFVAEKTELELADRSRMRAVCRRCPLLAQCHTYARAAKPPGGFWAGAYWGKNEPPD